jgi:CheY-like chemotaxis protein
MKRILLVDDDATIVEIYRRRLVQEGFQVDAARDGVEAAASLRAHPPDLVVLDLLMPRLSGTEVLRYIRSHPGLKSMPVAIFTNSFLTDLADAANELGVQRTIVKAACTPDAFVDIVNELLAGAAGAAGAPAARTANSSEGGSAAKMRQHFLEHAPDTLAILRQWFREFAQTSAPSKRVLLLEGLARKLHFTASLAGLSGCHHIALLAGAFEALVFELQQRPARVDASTIHTIAMAGDFLEVLFDEARHNPAQRALPTRALIVDDDPLSNHLAVAALRRAQLDARATGNPLTGLELLEQSHYDLVLLDIEMPGMNGFELCRKLRVLPGYAETPVIFFTAHGDFESRAAGVLSGGDDLIAKPIFPYELALKAVMHLIRSSLPAASTSGMKAMATVRQV